jgi:hypothetical protein
LPFLPIHLKDYHKLTFIEIGIWLEGEGTRRH